MPYINEHAARINDPNKYEKIRRENDKFAKGIHVIWGILSDGKTEIQAIRFDSSKYSVADAKKWLKDHDYKPIMFEPASDKENYNMDLLEYKTVNFEILECKDENIDGMECFKFKGYASTFGNADLGGDVCMKGCFAKSLIKRTPKLLWQHDTKMPLGIFPSIMEDDKGLFFDACMPKGDTFVSGRVVPQMKIKSLDTMSIGYNTVDSEMIKGDNGEFYRALKEVDLWEASIVTFAMNPEAAITDSVKDMISQIKNINDVSKLLKKYFTKSQTDDIIFHIKKFNSCNESSGSCNENIFLDGIESYISNIKAIKKEI